MTSFLSNSGSAGAIGPTEPARSESCSGLEQIRQVKPRFHPGPTGLHTSPEYLLELGFEGERRSSLDLRPGLPLLFTPYRTEGEHQTSSSAG